MRKKLICFLESKARICLIILAYVTLICSCKKPEAQEKLKNNSIYLSGKSTQSFSIDQTISSRLGPPGSVSSLYSTVLNPKVSDDFNDTVLDMSKWHYRTDGSSNWSVSSGDVYNSVSGGTKFVSIRGNYSTQKSAGLVSNDSVKYGFYIVKWQVIGIDNSTANGWHPSVWGGPCDYSKWGTNGLGNCPVWFNSTAQWVEPDFMEGFDNANPYWDSHVLQWDKTLNPSLYIKKNTMIVNQTIWPNSSTDWKIMGLEYTPNYIAVWTYNSGSWGLKQSYPITTGAPTLTNISSKGRKALYWVFSNKLNNPSLATADSWLHVDYFYLYDYVGAM